MSARLELPEPPAVACLDALVRLLRGKRWVALTGAGISTESGIPDYRGPTTRHRARDPIQHSAFVRDAATRRRYWARSAVGWPRIRDAVPAAGHRALAELEAAGRVAGVITQNVDRLHDRAGTRCAVELHGALAEVVCLACGAVDTRERVQQRLLARNPGWTERVAAVAPDGDAALPPALERRFSVVACTRCAGDLKPNVVFFGGSVPRSVVDAAWRMVEAAGALVVVGSSLAVFSGYRFVRGAAQRGIPVAIVNLGPTRGDPHAAVRIDARAGDILPRLARALA